jgi:hypothetical protein
MLSTSNFHMNAAIKWPSFSESGLIVHGTLVVPRNRRLPGTKWLGSLLGRLSITTQRPPYE